MKEQTVFLVVKVKMEIADGETADDVIQEMDYSFIPSSDTKSKIVDTEILDTQVSTGQGYLFNSMGY